MDRREPPGGRPGDRPYGTAPPDGETAETARGFVRDPPDGPEAVEPTRGLVGDLPDEPEAAGPAPGGGRSAPRRIRTDPEHVERDLSCLVLTVVELVRQLVERQCVRRMDHGDLADEQVEALGLTLMRLDEAMDDLCDRFGLERSDLNLDLGPLGTLLPRD
ncbi:gas vesicle protein K [Streptosporangium pseudovulgare]|uniref:Gas vesicle protein K n=1 Tax=Streptosporangium pseudovulgare TaxID=35765 RepID=A0ABQ2QKQ3_9ACTN|nr:gas vesicle protein K [Streptosporangium pseudovulgare]GGP84852.1 hypothetical protein GCM10010140_12560 [Streptosporangium pseudovulgare]